MAKRKAKHAASSLINYAIYATGFGLIAGSAYFIYSKYFQKTTTPPSGLAISVNPTTVAQGSNLSFSISGGTPNGSVNLNVGSLAFAFSPPLVFSSTGTASGSFTVGTNIAVGSEILTVTDPVTGKSAGASFTVTS